MPEARQAEAVRIAGRIAAETRAGDPRTAGTTIGPVVNQRQFAKIQSLIETGIKEGAQLVAGGPGRPEGLTIGYYVRPTIFADVRNDCIAADIVYVPLETEFLKEARHFGLTSVDGLGMLLHQAVPGFEKWFGVRPEVTDELRQILVADIEGR